MVRILEDVPDPLSQSAYSLFDGLYPSYSNLALGGLQQPVEVLDERGLPRPVLPKDGEELALPDLQIHALQSRNAVWVTVREPLDLDDHLAVAFLPRLVGREQLLVAFGAHPPAPAPELLDAFFGRQGKLLPNQLVEKAGHPKACPGLFQEFHIAQDLPRGRSGHRADCGPRSVGVQGLLGLVLATMSVTSFLLLALSDLEHPQCSLSVEVRGRLVQAQYARLHRQHRR